MKKYFVVLTILTIFAFIIEFSVSQAAVCLNTDCTMYRVGSNLVVIPPTPTPTPVVYTQWPQINNPVADNPVSIISSSTATSNTLSTSTATTPPSSTPHISINTNLGYGSTGEQVMQLQQFLISTGYLQGSATGNFYSLTQLAVKDFQFANSIPTTGYVGTLTRAKINMFPNK